MIFHGCFAQKVPHDVNMSSRNFSRDSAIVSKKLFVRFLSLGFSFLLEFLIAKVINRRLPIINTAKIATKRVSKNELSFSSVFGSAISTFGHDETQSTHEHAGLPYTLNNFQV